MPENTASSLIFEGCVTGRKCIVWGKLTGVGSFHQEHITELHAGVLGNCTAPKLFDWSIKLMGQLFMHKSKAQWNMGQNNYFPAPNSSTPHPHPQPLLCPHPNNLATEQQHLHNLCTNKQTCSRECVARAEKNTEAANYIIKRNILKKLKKSAILTCFNLYITTSNPQHKTSHCLYC